MVIWIIYKAYEFVTIWMCLVPFNINYQLLTNLFIS